MGAAVLCGVVAAGSAEATVFGAPTVGRIGATDAMISVLADNGGVLTALNAFVSTDPSFTSSKSYSGVTSPVTFTLTIDALNLTPGTDYVFRFSDGVAYSPVGRFTTASVLADTVPVPEPASLMVLAGLLAAGGVLRRR